MLGYSSGGARLDRVLARLQAWRLAGIDIVGTQPLPGVSYSKERRNGTVSTLPVLPSDHFGLVARFELAAGQPGASAVGRG
jgi:tyrosyl-DNA phosphodiesterase 2